MIIFELRVLHQLTFTICRFLKKLYTKTVYGNKRDRLRISVANEQQTKL